jgi:hypothetical protein
MSLYRDFSGFRPIPLQLVCGPFHGGFAAVGNGSPETAILLVQTEPHSLVVENEDPVGDVSGRPQERTVIRRRDAIERFSVRG